MSLSPIIILGGSFGGRRFSFSVLVASNLLQYMSVAMRKRAGGPVRPTL